MKLIIKYGCDGSSIQSVYKQKKDDPEFVDASIFTASMVPLQLFVENPEHKVFWQNPKPSSTKYCRPILYEFAKETAKKTNSVISGLKEEINKLEATVVKKIMQHLVVKLIWS